MDRRLRIRNLATDDACPASLGAGLGRAGDDGGPRQLGDWSASAARGRQPIRRPGGASATTRPAARVGLARERTLVRESGGRRRTVCASNAAFGNVCSERQAHAPGPRLILSYGAGLTSRASRASAAERARQRWPSNHCCDPRSRDPKYLSGSRTRLSPPLRRSRCSSGWTMPCLGNAPDLPVPGCTYLALPMLYARSASEEVRHVRDLHRLGDLGGRCAPGPGAPRLPATRRGSTLGWSWSATGSNGFSIADPDDPGERSTSSASTRRRRSSSPTSPPTPSDLR